MVLFKINGAHIVNNIKQAIKFIHSQQITKFFYVIKDNAYGHGTELILRKILKECAIHALAVAKTPEALEARKICQSINSNIPILCLGIVDEEDIPDLVENNISLTISNLFQLKKLINANVDLAKVKIHIKLNTGMNRLGFNDVDELKEALTIMKNKNIFLEGIFSHLYNASNYEDNLRQFNKFRNFIEIIPNWENIPYRHIRASTGIKMFDKLPKQSWETTVRFGDLAYFEDTLNSTKYNTVQITANIIQINNIKAGETVGYHGAYTAKENERIALVPIGYGDGFDQLTHQKGYLYYNNIKCPIVGEISMDSLAIKIPGHAQVGDLIYVVKDFNHLYDLASFSSNPNDEILSILINLNSRVKRVLVDKF